MPVMEKKLVLEHIREHLEYPATKKDLVTACNNMMDVPKEDKEYFEKNLPDRVYNSPDEVIKVLKL